MKYSILSLFVLISLQGIGQIGLGFYDLPYWGETYFRKNLIQVSETQIPASVYDSTETELYWDFSQLSGETFPDTAYYFWVEGTPAAFDFPDANMVDYNPEVEGGAYQYFIKDETGFYLSGQSSSMSTQMGDFEIKAEFRPAVPLIQVPARLGDEVSESSRASVDLLTFGKVLITTNSKYVINGYGTVKIPGGEEQEVLRIKRETENEAIVSVQFGPQEIKDTTLTYETSYAFYASGYGDAIAQVTISTEENLGLEQYSFAYKDKRVKSSLQETSTASNMSVFVFQEHKQLLVKDENLKNGGLVEIVNLNGQTLKQTKALNEVVQIGIETLSPGIYIVKSTNSDILITTKTIAIK